MCILCRLPDGSSVLFRYYLLGGDTAAPIGLYASLCHAFIVLYETLQTYRVKNVRCVANSLESLGTDMLLNTTFLILPLQ